GRVSAEADLVVYWFVKAWRRITEGDLRRVGLVATNSIRGGPNRRILDTISLSGVIFDAWDDEPWILDGAAVRVSLVCFGQKMPARDVRRNGAVVQRINADLSAETDFTNSRRLSENFGRSFQGPVKVGPFDIAGSIARSWLLLPTNPNGKANV